jgi:tripartite-type tricarboxylate transporter receptor subunit TctC
VATAPADGHTILLVLPGQMAVNPALYKDLPYNPVRDFAPIIQLTSFEVALAVNPSVAARNVNELVALAKSKPRGLTLASAGTGSAGHMAAIWFSMKTGVEWLHVPYKGAGPAFTDLIGGQVDLTFATTLSTLPHVRSGKLRALGVTGAKRSAAAPDIPAIAETVPGYVATSWYGIGAPAGTPEPILARLETAIAEALKSADIQKRWNDDLGLDMPPPGRAGFDQFLAEDRKIWEPAVKASGVKLD